MAFGFGLACALAFIGPGREARNSRSLESAARPAFSPPGLSRQEFEGAVDLVVQQYVEPIDQSRLYSRALQEMVAGLDPHSLYLDANARAAWQRVRARGLMTGLGLTWSSTRSESLDVTFVIAGSPAERAGLQPGDQILSIDGKPARSFVHPLEAELAAIREDPGGALLRVRPRSKGGKIVDVRLGTGRVAQVQVVESQLLSRDAGAKVGAICIHAFLPGVGDTVRRQLAELQRSAGGKLDALVIDLRGNPGGEVNEALVIAELFVAEGILTRTRGRGQTILREERAHAKGTNRNLPLVVLQDEHSASASELLAAALQANGRAQVIGRNSFGKGTVQTIHGLADGSQIRLTTARYYDPRDLPIEGRGVLPDLLLAADEMSDALVHAKNLALQVTAKAG